MNREETRQEYKLPPRAAWEWWLLGIAAFALLWSLLQPAGTWTGGASREVSISVASELGKEPLEGIEVRLWDNAWLNDENSPSSLKGAELEAWRQDMMSRDILGVTDGQGNVLLRSLFKAGGGSGGLFDGGGRFGVHHVLEISHPGYEPLRVTLASLLGGDRFPLSKKELAVKVWLIPKTAPH